VAATVRREVSDPGAQASAAKSLLNLAAAILLARVSVTVRSTEYLIFAMRQARERRNRARMKRYATGLAILGRDEIDMTSV